MKPKKLALLFPLIYFAAISMFLRSWIPFFQSTWHTLLVGCILSFFIVQRFFRERWFLLILLYLVVVILNFLFGDSHFSNYSIVINEFFNLFLFSSTIYYVFMSDDRKCIYFSYYGTLVMLGIAAIGSLYVNSIVPSIVRLQVEYAEAGTFDDVLDSYFRLGLSNYLLPHGLPIIIPPLILLIRRSRHNKKVFFSSLLLLLFSLILVYLGGTTTVLLLTFFALFSVFLNKKTSKNSNLVYMGLILLPFIINPGLLSDVLGIFGVNETTLTYFQHLDDLSDYATSGSGSNTAKRMELYSYSLHEFLISPFWGTNEPMTNHSVLLDRLGALGLIGFLPLIACLLCFYKFIHHYLDSAQRVHFFLSFVIALLILLTKGIGAKEVWFMFLFFAPCLLYLSCNRIQK